MRGEGTLYQSRMRPTNGEMRVTLATAAATACGARHHTAIGQAGPNSHKYLIEAEQKRDVAANALGLQNLSRLDA